MQPKRRVHISQQNSRAYFLLSGQNDIEQMCYWNVNDILYLGFWQIVPRQTITRHRGEFLHDPSQPQASPPLSWLQNRDSDGLTWWSSSASLPSLSLSSSSASWCITANLSKSMHDIIYHKWTSFDIPVKSWNNWQDWEGLTWSWACAGTGHTLILWPNSIWSLVMWDGADSSAPARLF